MDTYRIKKFATEARNKLKAGIAAKIITLGFDKNGNVPEHMHPQLMQGGSLWNGQLQTEGFYHQWQALYKRVQQKGIKEVYEEAAYTWFNRLVAIRILQKNGLIEPVLAYVDAARTPRIVDEARMGRIPQMQERQRQLLMELLDDDSKTTEQFAILVTAFCHDNPILFKCFGAMSDYTELLLPNDILTEGGFIDLLNHTEFITDTDFHSPELIGWLYQFYISERKDEVFAKKGKFEADEIPAATQIFTPNWIVKYMVQNTIGRIYLDNNPSAASEFKPKWMYLVEPSEPTPKESIYKFKELTELLTGDLACGSGHILNECFDLLYDLYIYEGYSRREAIENIFKCNLRGVDLDTRAKQLATFALMLKACQKDASFADAHILPKVLDVSCSSRIIEFTNSNLLIPVLEQFFNSQIRDSVKRELLDAFNLMQDADSLGSIMKFDLAESTKLAIRQTMNYWRGQGFMPETVENIMPAMDLMITLTDKYAALVMNPPYMSAITMNDCLSSYLKVNYSEGKADLFSTFMLLAINRLNVNGKYGMINMHSWLFLPSFYNLRKKVLNEEIIDNLLHLGPRTFDELSGEVVQNAAFVITNTRPNENSSCSYFRLVDAKNCDDKETLFVESKINNKESILYRDIKQNSFILIPGSPIGYWISESFLSSFRKKKISSLTLSDGQILTGDNNRFLRLFWETDKNKTGINQGCKWTLMAKGGGFRKWYGNIIDTVNWSPEARDFYRKDRTARILDEKYWYREAVTWGVISTIHPSFRLLPQGYLFNKGGYSLFFNNPNDKFSIIGLLNSRYAEYILNMINPTLSTTINDVQSIPWFDNEEKKDVISSLSETNISLSKQDWDSHETSWDFEANPLVVLRNETVASGNLDSSFKLSALVEQFKTIWEERFNQLHQNEEELNRQFIEIYGLQDELSPELPLTEITILQQGEISIED